MLTRAGYPRQCAASVGGRGDKALQVLAVDWTMPYSAYASNGRIAVRPDALAAGDYDIPDSGVGNFAEEPNPTIAERAVVSGRHSLIVTLQAKVKALR